MKKTELSTTCYRIEGNLFLSNQLDKVFVGQNLRQKTEDYLWTPGLFMKEECSRAFRIGKASWDAFVQSLSRNDLSEEDRLARTKLFANNLLGNALNYLMIPVECINYTDRQYPVSFVIQCDCKGKEGFETATLPVSVVAAPIALDTAVKELAVIGSGNSKKSAFTLAQELLNVSPEYRWGMAFNGLTLRLLRDSMSLTRPSFLEFNLQEIFANADYAQFMHLWMALHASRAVLKNGNTAWDEWIKQGEEAGQPAREALSSSIMTALEDLGNGFLAEPSNVALREALANGTLTAKQYTHELLRLMYRFLFVFCLEERELLHTCEDTEANQIARQRYSQGYSFHRFREMSCKKRFYSQFTDAWESVCIVFDGLENGQTLLALPALGGLFKKSQCPHLSEAKIANKDFFKAMYAMRWAVIEKVLAPIDYRNMGTEELGSIYESLLELVPFVDVNRRSFGFMSDMGAANERKKTGSYYTPDAFVGQLIQSALDPVIEKRLNEQSENPEEALLSLSVIDPSCGSGHFLLAAARRIAERLALVRSADGIVTPGNYRIALRDVIQHCIYGVDLNPLAVELARMALWLEGYAEGKPLSFLDHHLKVGNSLIGVFDLSTLKSGISKEAYVPSGSDEKVVCTALGKRNKAERDALEKTLGSSLLTGDMFLTDQNKNLLKQIETTSSQNLADVASKEALYNQYLDTVSNHSIKRACDLFIGAYLCEKTQKTATLVPTSAILGKALIDPTLLTDADVKSIEFASKVCERSNVFHWPLEFPHIFAQGGFDCVLSNPPWEKAKVEDKKWFAKRQPVIEKASTAAIRKQMIDALQQGQFSTQYLNLPYSEERSNTDKELFNHYMAAIKNATAGSILGHLSEEDGGRFPLTGRGDTNLAAYFSELALNLRKADGTVGIVVPVGIITDDATKAYSQHILSGLTKSLYHFNNTEKLFPIDARYSFVLITLCESDTMDCVFYATRLEHLEDPERHVAFQKGDMELFNPNTRTCVLLRSKRDLELCRKIYSKAPFFVRENDANGNPWGVRFMSMFHMSNDSNLFHTEYRDGLVPLYEGKLFHQFDARWASYKGKHSSKGEPISEDCDLSEKQNFSFEITPRYWLQKGIVQEKFCDRNTLKTWWNQPWMLVFRNITSPTNERTMISSVLPSHFALGHSATVLCSQQSEALNACLLANLNSLVVDYIVRIKQSGMNLNMFTIKQLPILTPSACTEDDVVYIKSRVAKLTRNNDAISKIWLTEYPTYQYQEPLERLRIRAELDAYFAHLYGLTRDDLCYILDPEDVMGKDFPSVTFPGLKGKEQAAYGKYLTQQFVLDVYDELQKSSRFATNQTTQA